MSVRRGAVGLLLIACNASPPASAPAAAAHGDAVRPTEGKALKAVTPSPTEAAARNLEPIRARAGSLLAEHCVRCHGEGNALDFRSPASLPPPTWHRIEDAVRSAEMPPPSTANPFPLDPEPRKRLADDALELSRVVRPAKPRPVVYDAVGWVALLHEVADELIGSDAVNAVINEHRGGIAGLRDEPRDDWTRQRRGAFLFPLAQANMNRIGYGICRKMVDARGNPFVVAAPQPDATHAAAALHRHVYREEPSPAELEEEAALLQRVTARSNQHDAVVALCTAFLSGPKLLAAPEQHEPEGHSP